MPRLPKLTLWSEHPTYAASAGAKDKAKRRRSAAEAPAKRKLRTLPEWNLADLYGGRTRRSSRPTSKTSERAADAMQERYAGKLAVLLDGGKGGRASPRRCASSRP